MRLRAVVAVGLFVGVAAGCGGTKPHFGSAPGWHLLAGHHELAAGRVIFAPADRRLELTSPPSRTVASLPRDGTVIWATYLRGGNTHYPRRKLPLRVEQGEPSNPVEGFHCAPAVKTSRCFSASGSVWRLFGRYGAYDLDVYVFFGTDHPVPSEFAGADAELALLRLPGAPTASTPKPAECRKPAGTGYYDTAIRPSSGPPGTTVVVSGRVPPSSAVTAYWNLDLDHWSSITTSDPVAAHGGPVEFLGTQNVTGLCAYDVRVTIPTARPGSYPIDVLYGEREGSASLAPVTFRVTSR